MTFTITLTVSPGANSGIPRFGVTAFICSRSISWIMFMFVPFSLYINAEERSRRLFRAWRAALVRPNIY